MGFGSVGKVIIWVSAAISVDACRACIQKLTPVIRMMSEAARASAGIQERQENRGGRIILGGGVMRRTNLLQTAGGGSWGVGAAW